MPYWLMRTLWWLCQPIREHFCRHAWQEFGGITGPFEVPTQPGTTWCVQREQCTRCGAFRARNWRAS